jgi:acetylornithine deacetylase/succinyl-diaminopimelate desuccinylase family protein
VNWQLPELLAELVRRPSQNPMGLPLSGPGFGEAAVTDFLEALFREWNLRYLRQPVLPGRENIIAFCPGREGAPVFLWEAHQDTVPAGDMVEAFRPRIENGRLYGRGACDVKGALAAMLAALGRLMAEPKERRYGIVLACVVDEEYTFRGVRELVKLPLEVHGAIVAEPTRLQIIVAHKGIVRWRIHTQGRSCHSSQPELGVNAIYRMAGVVQAVEQYAEWLRSYRRDPRLGPATLSVGRIEGGISANIVPERCTIDLDRRVLPGEELDQVPKELADFLGRTIGPNGWHQEEPWMALPPLSPEGKEALVARLREAVYEVRGRADIGTVAYGTDASTLQAAGIPCVVFGPGDIAQAHTAEEWIALDELEQAAEILYRFGIWRSG